ncbi:MAG: hypothetical protein K5Q00_02845 [Gammaproteobacteria bacterium]|nr:hypothetical protein [Gammaproteobacteria bacterium]
MNTIVNKKNYYFWALGIILLLLTACTSVNTATYDPQTDQTVTMLQLKTDRLMGSVKANLNTPAAAYKNYAQQYQTILLQLHVLITRNEALPYNKTTVDQLNLLSNSIEKFQERHELGFSSTVELTALQQLVDAQFRSILTVTLAKPHASAS